MSSDFNITSELRDKILILKPDGYINNTGGEKILAEFSKNYSGAVNTVIMDLEKCKVVNSIGISYIIDIIEQIGQNNGKMIFTNLDPTIDKTFDIMGLYQFAEKADISNYVL